MSRPGWRAGLVGWVGVLCAASCAHPPEPLDDEGPAANRIEGERRPMAECPNGGNVKPAAPYFDAGIEGYPSYVGQTDCDPNAKPGAIAFRNLVLATYPCTSDGGIARDCSVGGTSEHKEGRAWDWMLDYPHPAADAFLGWLTATDAYGNQHAMARRLGIMYMIWNRQMWRAYDAAKGWQAYTGDNPHTDHVHFSFTWDGASKATSYWSPPTQPSPDARPLADTAAPRTESGLPIMLDMRKTPAADRGEAPEGDAEPLGLGAATLQGGCAASGPHPAPAGGLALLLLVCVLALRRQR